MSRVVHFEFIARDPERLARFYSEALGWKVTKWEGPMEYWLVETGAEGTPGINGGIARTRDASHPSMTVNTLSVEDLDASLGKVTAAGGHVVVPRHAIPGIGYLAYCTDPEGVVFGMMQSDPAAH